MAESSGSTDNKTGNSAPWKWAHRVAIETDHRGAARQWVTFRGLGTVEIPATVKIIGHLEAELSNGNVVWVRIDESEAEYDGQGNPTGRHFRGIELCFGPDSFHIHSSNGIEKMPLRQALQEWADAVRRSEEDAIREHADLA